MGAYEDSEVGDFGQRLRDDELEGDVGEEEDEAELQAVRDEVDVHCERREYQTANEHLQHANNLHVTQMNYNSCCFTTSP